MARRSRTEGRVAASVRRWGLPAIAAVLGGVLLVCGLVVAVVDAQARSNAATAAVIISEDERARLEDLDFYEFVLAESAVLRRSLVMQNLASGGPMPERAFAVVEMEDGNAALSWSVPDSVYQATSWGGWQMKPVGILTFAGLILLIASGFLSAGRWESRHPLA